MEPLESFKSVEMEAAYRNVHLHHGGLWSPLDGPLVQALRNHWLTNDVLILGDS